MSWWQVTVVVENSHLSEEDADRIESVLFDAGAESVTLQDARLQNKETPLFELEPGQTPLWHHTMITGLYPESINPESICERVSRSTGLDISNIAFKSLEDQNWTRAWMKYFRPMSFGNQLWVIPEGYEPPDPGATNLYLDPGMAFGTGTHETTALCLQWLARNNLKNFQVIDYGCGSGILAIAAIALGARHAWCIDIDPLALKATKENGKKNHVIDQLSVGYPDDLVSNTTADLLIANILAEPLISLVNIFAKLLKTNSKLILSGIMTDQIDAVKQAYKPEFFNIKVYQNNNWALLECRRQ